MSTGDEPGAMSAGRGREMKSSIDNAIKEICIKEGVGEKELRMGVRTRKYSGVRAKIAYYLSHELGISKAGIARQLNSVDQTPLGSLYKKVKRLNNFNLPCLPPGCSS
jgi:hypothetical protein